MNDDFKLKRKHHISVSYEDDQGNFIESFEFDEPDIPEWAMDLAALRTVEPVFDARRGLVCRIYEGVMFKASMNIPTQIGASILRARNEIYNLSFVDPDELKGNDQNGSIEVVAHNPGYRIVTSPRKKK